jgi:hypothetical protein
MTRDQAMAFLAKWRGPREQLYGGDDHEPSDPSSRIARLSRERFFEPIVRPAKYRHNGNFNYILDDRIRVTPIGRHHWNERLRLWWGFGEVWNRRSRTWSEPRLLHYRVLETEEDHV